MGWHRQELESRVREVATSSSAKDHLLTKVIGALLHHLAIDFPQTIAGVDDLEGV